MGRRVDKVGRCGDPVSDFLRPVYPVDKVDLKNWFTDKDIQNAKSRMQGWVHSLARTGR